MSALLDATDYPSIDLELTRVALITADRTLAERVRVGAVDAGVGDITHIESITAIATLGDVDVVLVGGGRRRADLIAAYKLAREACGTTPIIGLWPEGERPDTRLALRNGVDGLLLESELETSLAAALQTVLSGQICIPRTTIMSKRAATLTSREKQILAMLIMGFTNGEIGRRLFLAESTVKSHLSSAYLKLGVRSRKDAAALILDPDEGLGTKILAIAAG